MKIPFSFLPVQPDSAFPNRSEIKRPIVALLLSAGDRSIIVFAVIDSGADLCVFPASIATDLGIEIPNRSSSLFSGSNDTAQLAYFEQIQATILPMDAPNIEPNQEPLAFPLYAGFCDTLEHIGMGLLGQEGLFSRFAVNFNHAESYFEIL
jgi:hypothetical protein